MQMDQPDQQPENQENGMVEAIDNLKSRIRQSAIMAAVFAAIEIGKGAGTTAIIINGAVGAIIGWLLAGIKLPKLSKQQAMNQQQANAVNALEKGSWAGGAALLIALGTGQDMATAIAVLVAATAISACLIWAFMHIKKRYQ